VGIEDCLHIEFEYDATRLALDDDVTGRVHFLLVRIRLRTMELALVRRETVGAAGGGGAGSGSAGLPESETLTRFELMDGCPVRGEVIPIRMPLAGLDLTPTFSVDVAGGGASGAGGAGSASTFFSVRYFLNLVLLDDEDRRYFKSQELVLHRRLLDAGTAPVASAPPAAAPGAGGV
jgi:vacuolar protein sorting-associated protein 26